MRRRDALVGATVLVISRRFAGAQQRGKNARIGFVVTGDAFPRRFFDEAMRRLGWIEGRNLIVDRRVTGSDPERRKVVAAELVAEKPDVIVAAGVFDARPVFAATQSIPIVIITGGDLVENGFVESLAHPGRNVTGMTVLGEELDGKRLELLHELTPEAKQIAVIGMNTGRYATRMTALANVAQRLSISISPRLAGNSEEMEAAYDASVAAGDQAILQMASPIAFENQPRIITHAARLRLPTIYESRDFVENGGLMSYGQIWRYNFERSASLVDKILKGANPADLPVERPVKFELVINMKTGKALGLAIPKLLLERADEVLE